MDRFRNLLDFNSAKYNIIELISNDHEMFKASILTFVDVEMRYIPYNIEKIGLHFGVMLWSA